MRAKEFTINIPINIKINGDGEPEVSTGEEDTIDDNVGDFVPPLQQKIELMKKSVGVDSVYDDEETDELEQDTITNLTFADDDPIDV
jgi:hypothetical protein